LLTPSNDGLLRGQLLAGGTVNLNASGSFASSLVWSQGSRIHIGGAQGELDVSLRESGGTRTQRQTVASGGGSLNISGSGALILEGDLRAQGGDAAQAGGRASINLTAGRSSSGSLPPLRELSLSVQRGEASDGLQTATLPKPADLGGNSAASIAASNARISAAQLQAAGLADLSLGAQDGLRIENGVSLNLARQLQLDSPSLRLDAGARAELAATELIWANFANKDRPTQSNGTPAPLLQASAGSSTLVLTARENLVLSDRLVTQGLGSLALNAGQDLRLQSRSTEASATGDRVAGALLSPADLSLRAAQIYPATDTPFTVDVGSHRVSIARSSKSPADQPASAGGQLFIKAREIEQGGVVRAPFGRIELQASERLSLKADSETSVSGAGQQLVFGKADANGWSQTANPNLLLSQPLAKQLLLQAPALSLEEKALLDLSGGGQLSGWQFVPGPGGSSDVFTGSDGAFAMLPSRQLQALWDPSLAAVTPALGRQLEIGDGAAVPAGRYTLLPARYAMLAGAYLVRPLSGTPLNLGAVIPQADGSQWIGARLRDAGTAFQSALPSGWLLLSAEQARKRSEIRLRDIDSHFAEKASKAGKSLPAGNRDAAALVLNAQQLQMQASLLSAVGSMKPEGAKEATPGRGAQVFIASERIQIGGTADPSLPSTTLRLDTKTLEGIQAEQLVIGAVPLGNSSDSLQAVARELKVKAGSTLSSQDLLLSASETLRLEDGSHLKAEAPATTTSLSAGSDWKLKGGGAAVRVSAQADAGLQRQDLPKADDKAPPVPAAKLDLGAQVQLEAAAGRGSISLDSSGDSRVGAGLTLAGQALDLGARQVLIGAANAPSGSLSLDANLLQQLSAQKSISSLTLRSYSSIDWTAGASLGQTSWQSLTLDAPLLRAPLNGTGSALAQHIVLTQSSAQAVQAASEGTVLPAG
ncbi:MAG: hypothetical protein O9341_25240, partial [Paucibacter sp.]|nr:hypothetical protein [Roseateles sp.]